MIRIVGICGSRVKEGNTEALLESALDHAAIRPDVETELIALADKQVGPCIHCNWCIRKQTEDQPCVQSDDMAGIYPSLLAADGIILACPAHFGRLSGLLADAIDRTRAFVHGRVYKFPLKNKVGGSIATAFMRGGGLETTLSSMNMFFFVHQMVVASSGLYQLGAGALTSPEGSGRFKKEPRHVVLEDEMGVMAAHMLADRVVELARIVKAGQAALQTR